MSEAAPTEPFELEGMVSTLTVLRLLTADLPALDAALAAKVQAMPGFFQDAPIAFDLSSIDGNDADDPATAPAAIALADLVEVARAHRLVPVGIRNAREARQAEAAACGIGVLRGSGLLGKGKSKTKTDEPTTVDASQPAGPKPEATAEAAVPESERRQAVDRRREAAAPPTALTLQQPVRGGQVIYAELADAICLGHVNSGAELIADGNIHIYGALRGRALAGAHGNTDARIFCQSLEADLVSIAGTYLRADELPEQFVGKPVRICLEDGQLVVTAL